MVGLRLRQWLLRLGSQLELRQGTRMECRIQERFVIAQSWWLATEIVRQNTQLRILELHPSGGQSDTLGLFDTSSGEETIHLNRSSGGRIHFMNAPDIEPIEWSEVFSSSPHVLVERIERLGGLTPPAQTPPTERHALTYRVIATILAQMVNAKAMWDARSAFVDTAGYGGGTIETLFDDFPTAARQRETAGRVAVLDNAAYAFWTLNRNDEAVAVLDEWGWLHHRKNTQAVDLMQIYKANGRSLTATVGQSLGGILK